MFLRNPTTEDVAVARFLRTRLGMSLDTAFAATEADRKDAKIMVECSTGTTWLKLGIFFKETEKNS